MGCEKHHFSYQWTVPKAKLRKFFDQLDRVKIDAVLHFECSCLPHCGSYFGSGDILEARAKSILHDCTTYISNLLQHDNDRARQMFRDKCTTSQHIQYFFKRVPVCRPFFLHAFNISQNQCKTIRREIVGDESYKMTMSKKPIRFPSPNKPPTKSEICDAFWSSLAPSPVEGLYLWPGNRTRKAVFVFDFVDWFVRTLPSRVSNNCSQGFSRHQPGRVAFHDVPINSASCGSSLESRPSTLQDLTLSNPEIQQPGPKRPEIEGVGTEMVVFCDVPIDVSLCEHKGNGNNLFEEVVESDSDFDTYDNVISKDIVNQLPSFSVFCKCRHHSWFDKVKNRPHHTQARCPDCDSLQMSCRIAWRNGLPIEKYKEALKLHNDETRRTFENRIHFDAKQYRGRMIVLSYDDTSALFLPRLSRRAPKGPKGGVGFVPWNIENHGAFENHYFYTLKHVIPKGSNRICTFIYYYLFRLKMFDNCQSKCQRLILMADNFSENKCNLFLCFLSHLIYWKWFTTIELYFGPVGHTHNGNDSVHHCHNNIAGDFHSITLPEFLSVFPLAWSNLDARPQPVFFEHIYDWETYYSGCFSALSGLTKTATRNTYIRALKLEVGKSGRIELTVKESPSDEKWTGMSEVDPEFPGAEGFVILRKYPEGTPDPLILQPDPKVVSQILSLLRHRQYEQSALAADLGGSLEWLRDLVRTSKMPTHGVDNVKIVSKAQHFGSVEQVGVETRLYDLPIIRPEKMAQPEMFHLKEQKTEVKMSLTNDNVKQPVTAVGSVCFMKRKVSKSKRAMIDLRGKRRRPNPAVKAGSNKKNDAANSADNDEPSCDDDEEVTYDSPHSWGQKIEDCHTGCYAVVHSLYSSGFGLSITKVLPKCQCFVNGGVWSVT